jgi:hypothetical protein
MNGFHRGDPYRSNFAAAIVTSKGKSKTGLARLKGLKLMLGQPETLTLRMSFAVARPLEYIADRRLTPSLIYLATPKTRHAVGSSWPFSGSLLIDVLPDLRDHYGAFAHC